ncbi:MAG: ParA family protein [Rikenellaceae bacterium]|jgi:cellulose biosynthesis protein BcsQ|nr:ParA family protein [Rikenellaceae bacterium]
MKKEPLFIAFSTQKGGVGKSTFTVLMASYLHYLKGLNVAVMDCDYPQCSVYEMRKREIRQLETNLHYQSKAIALFESLGKQTYPIVCAKPEEGIAKAHEFLASEPTDYDVVFFDLPGTINNDGVIATFMAMDYIFVPMAPSRMSMESTLSFIIPANELLAEHSDLNLKAIHLFWNRVDGRIKKAWLEHYEGMIRQFGLRLLKTSIPQSVRYDKEQSIEGSDAVFLSTIFPADITLLKGSNLDLLVDEISEIIHLTPQS